MSENKGIASRKPNSALEVLSDSLWAMALFIISFFTFLGIAMIGIALYF